MIVVPAPAQGKRDGVGRAIADKFGLHHHAVVLVGDDIHVDCDPADEAKVRAAVKAHKPPKPRDPVEPLSGDEVRQLRDLLANRRGG